MRWRFRQVTANEAWSRIALLIEHPNDTPTDDPKTSAGKSSAVTPQPGFDDEPTSGLFGPTCPYTRTLKTAYPWKKVKSSESTDGRIDAWLSEIPETCLWEPVHPFLYDAIWTDSNNAEAVRSNIGIRTVGVSEHAYLLNGNSKPLRGIVANQFDDAFLRQVRELRIEFLYARTMPGDDDLNRCDSQGPFLVCPLPPDFDRALEFVAAAGPTRPSVGIWLLPDGFIAAQVALLKSQDPASLFARILPAADATETGADADLLLVNCNEPELADLTVNLSTRFVAVVAVPNSHDDCLANWPALAAQLDEHVGKGCCVGWIVEPANIP